MKPLPTDPFAFRAHVFAALCDDIADTKARGFPRTDALREISKQSTREAGSAQEAPARNHGN